MMKNIVFGALGTLFGGWLLVWMPGEAVFDAIRALDNVEFSAWLNAPIQLPAWYIILSATLLVGLSVWAGITTVRRVVRKNPATGNKLPEDEEHFLQIICNYAEQEWQPTASEIAKNSNMSLVRTEHALEQLENKKMICGLFGLDGDVRYALESNGRAYLLRATE